MSSISYKCVGGGIVGQPEKRDEERKKSYKFVK